MTEAGLEKETAEAFAGRMTDEQKALEMLAEAGFKDIRVEHVDGDIFNDYYIARK
jgi:hypothetical protein